MYDYDPRTLFVLLVACLVALAIRRKTQTKPVGRPLPGPRGLPFIGNLHQLPKHRPWLKMAEWTRQYGPIYRLRLGFTEMVVIGSAPVAIELLEKRSAKYSSRPRLVMASELVSRGLRMTFMPYGDRWRRERKLLHLLTQVRRPKLPGEALLTGLHGQPKAAATYETIQDQESITLISDLLKAPHSHWGHAQRCLTSSRPDFNRADGRLAQLRGLDDHADLLPPARAQHHRP